MKGILLLGYKKYVMDAVKAVEILQMLEGCELYETKYRKAEDGGTTTHIYDDALANDTQVLELLTDAAYRMAKLAGRPEAKP